MVVRSGCYVEVLAVGWGEACKRSWKHMKKWRPVAMLHKKADRKSYSGAYSRAWRHDVALLSSVEASLPKALWTRL